MSCVRKNRFLQNSAKPVLQCSFNGREIARKYDLDVANKKDSTDVCFINSNFREFISLSVGDTHLIKQFSSYSFMFDICPLKVL